MPLCGCNERITHMFIPILSVATAVFATLTIVLRRQGKSFQGMLCKFISSFGFMSIAFIGFCYRIEAADKLNRPFYFCLIAFGLLFGLGGDVLLGIKEIAPKYKNKLIALGTVSFLIGHFFYLAAFYNAEPTFSFIPYLAALILTVTIAMIMKTVKMKLEGKMYFLCVFYFYVIALGACVSAHMLYMTREITFVLTTIASALFVISDSVLAFIYFTPVKRKNPLVTLELATYYAGQVLMAVTVFLVK